MKNINMTEWLEGLKDAEVKKSMPILSFPAVQLLGCSVKDIISSSDLQAQGMKLIADKTPSLASVSLMDLSVEAECFGCEVVFSDDDVPTVHGTLVHDLDEAEALTVPKVGEKRTGLCIEAVKKACELIADRPVFAGVIGSFSLAGRLTDVTEALVYCYTDPDLLHAVLEKCTEFLINYITEFKRVGANGVVIAEPLAGLLSPDLADEFSSAYIKKIVDSVQTDDFIVIYHNCGNTVGQIADSIISTGAAAFHFGNAVDMREMLEKMPANKVVMGNVDPVSQFKNGTEESIKEATLSLLKECSCYTNFVISSGCDIPPLSKWENIIAYYSAIDEFYSKKNN